MFRSIRVRLLLLVLLALLPIAGVVTADARGAYAERVARFENGTDRLLALARERAMGRIAVGRALLAGLPASGRQEEDRGGRCDPSLAAALRRLAPAATERGLQLALLAPDAVASCTPGPLSVEALALLRRLSRPAEAAADAEGAVVAGASPGGALLALRGPGDAVGRTVAAAVAPLGELGRQLGEEGDEVLVWLGDGPDETFPSGPGTPTLRLDALVRRDLARQGHAYARLGDGRRAYVAATPLAPGLILLVGRPEAAARAHAWREAWHQVAELSAFLVLSFCAVAVGANVTVVRPLQNLRGAVGRWRRGGMLIDAEELEAMPDEVRELAETIRHASGLVAEREDALRAALAQRDLLMAEIHHRVKNNLQIVSSLLNLQAQRIREPVARREFEAARDRVRALATLHRHLYAHPDHETVDLAAFIRELAGQLFLSLGERPDERIALGVEAPSLRISSDQAVPLALVITEAMTNVLKFAFPAGRRGRLDVRVTEAEGRVRLAIADDGVGIAAGDTAAEAAAAEAERGLGGQLVRGLTRQLGGRIEVAVGVAGGTVVTLDFPLRSPTMRLATVPPAGGDGPPGGAAG